MYIFKNNISNLFFLQLNFDFSTFRILSGSIFATVNNKIK